jgi:hypothetical protein
VFTARYALSPYIKQIRFVFKGLMNYEMEEMCCTKRHWSNLRHHSCIFLEGLRITTKKTSIIRVCVPIEFRILVLSNDNTRELLLDLTSLVTALQRAIRMSHKFCLVKKDMVLEEPKFAPVSYLNFSAGTLITNCTCLSGAWLLFLRWMNHS